MGRFTNFNEVGTEELAAMSLGSHCVDIDLQTETPS